MHRYFLHIGYNGASFSGWQSQPRVATVQQTIEAALAKIYHQRMVIFGCGRTDAGVHANQYFLHFDVVKPLNTSFKFILNKNLPSSIVVYDVISMLPTQHAQYDAIRRTYNYYIHTTPDPFLLPYSTYLEVEKLDIEQMTSAVEFLASQDDFVHFCRSPQLYKNTKCKIYEARLSVSPSQTRLRLTITANRFLKGMIRLIMYQIIELGKGQLRLEDFKSFFDKDQARQTMRLADPYGLYLSKVVYPYLDLPEKKMIVDQW